MKTITTLLLTLACLITAVAQTNPPAPTDASAPNSVAIAPTADTNAPATPPLPSPVDTNAVATNAPAPAPATMSDTNAAPAAALAEDTAAAATAPAGIPQIKFSDVPITTAIENLARLAGINYMLDPKIGYGQPDANGQIKVEPTLSIRWENITAESALLALLDNYGLQLTHDKRTGIDRITMKDPTAPPPLFTKVIQLKYAGVSNLLEHAQAVLTDKRSKVLTDSRTSQLVVVATDPEQQAVEALVNQLDKPTRQVLIETRLVEISSNPTTTKGVDWSGTLQSQHVNFGNGTLAGTITPGGSSTPTTVDGTGSTTSGGSSSGSSLSSTLINTINPLGAGGGGGLTWNTKSGFSPETGFLNADGLSAVLSFLNASSDAQVMSTPRIVTLDNELATISVTRSYPVFNVTAGSANNAGGSSVNYSNVGTILNVTPRISANDYIWLRVVPEVSSFFGYAKGPSVEGSPLIAPEFDSRRIETQVLIPNANTLVLGGLVKDSPSANYTKVPLLGDIPGLGFFFSSSSKSLDKDNLLIFITPTIIKDSDFQVNTKSSDFLKSVPTPMKQTMDPKHSWDSPMPRGNWADPITETTR